jgi:single-strand DNA-binding protein
MVLCSLSTPFLFFVMQQLIIIGNVGKQAEVRQAPNGQAIGFSVAVNETYKDKASGEKKEKTTWYKLTIWKKLGESTKIAEYLKPGQTVSVVGRPYADAYIKDGKAIGEQCVRVERLELVGTPKGQAGTTVAPSDELTLDERIGRPEDDNDLPF